VEWKLSLATIDREVTMIRAMFRNAVKWGKLAKNPAHHVKNYAADNRREQFLSNGTCTFRRSSSPNSTA